MKKHIICVIFFVLLPLTAFSDKVGGGDLRFTPKNYPPVVYSHEKHVTGIGLKCTRCHYAIFDMKYMSAKMDMGKMRAGEFCGKCHDGEMAFSMKQEAGNCARCHK